MKTKLLLAGLTLCACAFAQNMPSALSQSTLTANVLATGGGPVAISAPFPFIPSAPLNQGVIYMDSEAMLVLSANLSLNQLTVLRGYLGTTAAAHNAGILAFSGQPFQFISVDKSGSCDPNSPQFLNVTDQTYFTCTAGTWVGASTSNGGGGAGNPGGTNGQIQFNNNGVFGGLTSTGTGNVVRQTSPTLITPALGTPSALVLTNATGLPGGQITGANSVPASTLPLATTGAFGVVKPDGTTVTISGGVISSTGGGSYTLPIAATSVLGGIKPDGTTITVNAGTGVASATGGGTNNWTSNSGVPTANCTVGTGAYLYFDTAFTNPGMPIYYCSATNVWTQGVNLGGSGCLAFTAGSLDIVSACIPQKAVANTFTASQSEGLGAKWSSTHGTVTQTSGWAAISGGTSGAIGTSSIAALGTPTTAGDWVDVSNMNCTGTINYSIVATTSITITDTVSESCSVHWEIRHDN